MRSEQTCSTILMIRPASFGSNPETAATNAFQRPAGDLDAKEIHAKAVAEFDGLVAALRAADVEVIDVDDTPEPATPDAVFPNNWISFHATGEVVLYPMQAVSRRAGRAEVRRDLVDRLGYDADSIVDLTNPADEGQFLEGMTSRARNRNGVDFEKFGSAATNCAPWSMRSGARTREGDSMTSKRPTIEERDGADVLIPIPM